jgi:hypothetical protein
VGTEHLVLAALWLDYGVAGRRWRRADRGRRPAPDEEPLEGWERFDITPQQWEVIHPRVRVVLVDEGLWQQGVRFGFNFTEDKTSY